MEAACGCWTAELPDRRRPSRGAVALFGAAADVIVLMDEGAVMEVGSHDALMQRQGWYYALHQSQMQEGLG